MLLGESLEDYLETLLILEETGKIRCVDVATHLNVSKPSVNKAMNVLKDKGYVLQKSYGDIFLTDDGRKIAQSVYQRHRIITDFLVDILQVNSKTAEEDACHIEHIISDETFQKMKEFKKKYTK